jgi:hypothetical protein
VFDSHDLVLAYAYLLDVNIFNLLLGLKNYYNIR